MSKREMDDGQRVLARRIGARVRYYRLKSGLSQRQVAQRVDMTSQTVSNLERAYEGLPTMETLWKVATALDVEVPALFVPLDKEEADFLAGIGYFSQYIVAQGIPADDADDMARNRIARSREHQAVREALHDPEITHLLSVAL